MMQVPDPSQVWRTWAWVEWEAEWAEWAAAWVEWVAWGSKKCLNNCSDTAYRSEQF